MSELERTPGVLESIAVVGMSARFPRAANVEEYWRNLCAGVECVSFFSDEELAAAGVDRALLGQPGYVKAAALLEGVELFDNSFFGYSPREAEIMDPQQRLLLECAYHALENAGINPDAAERSIGVYVGSSVAHYTFAIYSNPDLVGAVDPLQITIGNADSHLATRISYKLNLRGPSLFVQSACSTSLVATHLACHSLLNYECDVALAGGVSITTPQPVGYLYQQGGVLSPDGHCRAFDAAARGTIIGNGVGVVVLKRLSDALADGDHVHALIRGSAINNDGSHKVGYTAPSVDGQSAVIAEAYALAGVDPATVTLIEAHGTGTELGDPIEVEALSQVFKGRTSRTGYCALGSVKTNFGHLLAAAGVASLIKTVLALDHEVIPPSLNFERPNPRIDFASSPFFVNRELSAWPAEGGTRRAGVSSFGIGGTNAHVVLEAAPAALPSGPSRPWQLLALAAKTASALDAQTTQLASFLRQQPDLNLADAAATLLLGRRAFSHRRVALCQSAADAAAVLAGQDARLWTGFAEGSRPQVVFLFPGQGAQRAGMGSELYRTEEVFRRELDRCCELLAPHLGRDLRQLLHPAPGGAGEPLDETEIAQPALFAVEYALARLWMSWGVQPAAMLGHSIGEYVAATLAGVFTLEDALALVASRGRLMQRLPRGAMLAVDLPAASLSGLSGDCGLAAVNGPSRCVVSGPVDEIAAFHERLAAAGVACRPLRTSHAFHSPMMEPLREPFRALVAATPRQLPRSPYLSNVSGGWIRPEDAVDADYWVRHLCAPVQLWPALAELRRSGDRIYLEVGPGRALSTLARQRAEGKPPLVVSALAGREGLPETALLLSALGQLWVAGVDVDWPSFFAGEQRRRVALPAYPFERRRYWAGDVAQSAAPVRAALPARLPLAEWFYIPSWKRSLPLPPPQAVDPQHWLLFNDSRGLGAGLARRLAELGHDATIVQPGPAFSRLGEGAYTIDPGQRRDYDALIADLLGRDWMPARIAHLWCVGEVAGGLEETLARGFFSLLFLAQALGRQPLALPLRLAVVTSGMQRVAGERLLSPEKATVLGPCKVIPQEYPAIRCRSLDLELPATGEVGERLIEQVLGELAGDGEEAAVAFRQGDRWVHGYERVHIETGGGIARRLRPGGVCLISGGLGGLGFVLARSLASAGARLVLTGRSQLPERADWQAWIDRHGTQNEVSRKIARLQEIEALGGEVMTAAVDVADRSGMRELVAAIERRFGALHGVIHCAGVAGGGMIQGKTEAAARQVLAAKVQGTLVLAEVLADAPLDLFVLCSSLASVRGGFGQVDYCAANAFLDAFAQSRAAAGDWSTVAVDWGAWAEVGMAVRAVTQRGYLPCPLWLKESSLGQRSQPVGHPLLQLCIREAEGETVFRSELGADDHWVLAEHRVQGRPTLPGTAYLELARAAFAHGAETDGVELSDVLFLSPLSVDDGEKKEIHTALERHDGKLGFRVTSKVWRGPDVDVQLLEHARGQIAPAVASRPPVVDLAAIVERTRALDLTGLPDGGETLVEPGPRWRTLQQVRVGESEALALLELAEPYLADLEGLALHPALLDVAVGFAKRLAGSEGNFLPLSYKRCTIHQPLPRRFFSHARWRASAPGRAVLTFDLSLLDAAGRVLVDIEEYTLRWIHDTATQLRGLDAADLMQVVGDEQLLSGGILSSEGVEALDRLLSREGLAQVVVSPRDVDSLIAEWNFKGGDLVEELGKAALSRPSHPRPDLGAPYLAPRNEVERLIAEVWQDLLGVSEVGVQDDFFALGGDSLLGIQVLSRLRERFAVELSPATLFERPTVAELATTVVAGVASEVDAGMLLALGGELSGAIGEGAAATDAPGRPA